VSQRQTSYYLARMVSREGRAPLPIASIGVRGNVLWRRETVEQWVAQVPDEVVASRGDARGCREEKRKSSARFLDKLLETSVSACRERRTH